MIVAADSSPLIILAKLGCFDLLHQLYSRLYISSEVHDEVVIAGAGMPGASAVAQAVWIEIKPLRNQVALKAAQQRFPLGVGELSTILLGKDLAADMVLLDDFNVRKRNRLSVRAGKTLPGRSSRRLSATSGAQCSQFSVRLS